jgi:integrase
MPMPTVTPAALRPFRSAAGVESAGQRAYTAFVNPLPGRVGSEIPTQPGDLTKERDMASLSRAADGRFTVQFVDIDNKRRSIRLGKVDKRTAEATRLRVEALLAAKIQNAPLDRDTGQWLAGIGAALAAKLAAVGLMERRSESALGPFTAAYIAKRTDVKPRTTNNMNQARTRLVDFFGAAKPLRSFTEADAENWLLWMKERYANATTGRAIKRARQFFEAARKGKWIDANPFAAVKPPGMVNESRKAFVERSTIEKVLAACPDAEWRLIVALARYAGIRIPSELLPLTWNDILWEQGRIFVRSPKTEHHEGGAGRFVPLFPELLPYLEACFDEAAAGALHVIERYRSTNQNLRTYMQRICVRAGVTPWPKLFHNLRASRETELAAIFPLHVVCAWIGNSAAIAKAHYLTVNDSDYEKATTGMGRLSGAKSGAEAAAALQNPGQSALDSKGQEGTQPLTLATLSPFLSLPVPTCPSVQTPPAGLEPALTRLEGGCIIHLCYGGARWR